jgi:hypothetical protein
MVVLHLLSPVAATDPPGLTVAGSEPQAAQPTGAISCPSGRFVPLNIVSGKPALVLGNEDGLLSLYPLKPGEGVLGIRFDEPAGAKTKRYTFPAGANWIAVAGDGSGTVNLAAVVNGATPADAPTVAGRLVIALHGPGPPPAPVPVPIPVPPVPIPVPVPTPLTPFQLKLQAAFQADGATAKELATYAALWRGAATTTVYDTGINSYAALKAEMQTAATNLSKGTPPAVRHGILHNTAVAVQAEIDPLTPVPAIGALTKPTRDAVAAIFTRIAKDLDTVGGAK